MKNKIVIVLLLLASIALLAESAGAASVDIDPSVSSPVLYHPLDGSTRNYPVLLDDMATGLRRIDVYVTNLDSINLSGDGINISGGPGTYSANWTATSINQTLSLNVTTSNSGKITIVTCLYDGSDCSPWSSVDFAAGSNSIDIPEFPTVALPAGAAVGLLFLLQRRRQK